MPYVVRRRQEYTHVELLIEWKFSIFESENKPALTNLQ